MKLTGHLLSENENKANRTHFSKHFIHPQDLRQQRILQQKKIVHAFTDVGWQDVATELPSYTFPEGTVINASASNHYIMDLPVWGTAVVSPDGLSVNVYDKKNVSVYVYKNPTVTPNGIMPYEVIDENGVFQQDSATLKTHGLLPEWTISRKAITQDATFQVINNKLYFVLPAGLTYPVQIWDDTDTSSVSNHDCRILKGPFPGTSWQDTNFDNSPLQIDIGNTEEDLARSIMEWTLSSGTGIVTDVQVDFNVTTNVSSSSGKTLDLHELTASFNEAQATWNNRLTATPWTTVGGDFSATVVDSVTWTGIGNKTIYLMGSNAANPITLNFGDTVDFILKWDNEFWAGSRDLLLMNDDSGATPPVMTITFTIGVTLILNEIITIVASIKNTTIKTFAEFLSVVETFLKSPQKIFQEIVSLVETFTATFTKILIEVVSVVDSFVKSTIKQLVDTIIVGSISETIRAKALFESITVKSRKILVYNGSIISSIWTKTVKAVTTWIKSGKPS